MGSVRDKVGVAVAAVALAVASAAGGADGFRTLAPGVLTVIPAPAAPPGSAAAATDTVSRADLLDITVGRADLAWKPLQSPANSTFVERGRDREYPRDVWHLEFAFKPPRMIDVDVPTAGLTMQRKRVWYLVYRVRNAGARRTKIDADDNARRETEAFETPIRFVPQFVLESLEPLDAGEGLASYRAYLDRVMPTAIGPISAREGGGRKLLDSAAMVAEPIGPGEERWGVATWEDVDPRIDFFSIYVRGLTNAFEWRQRPGVPVEAGDPPGSALEQALRTLRLDFWRPGDDRDETEDEMSVGFAGMFERMSLGTRLLEAVGAAGRDAAAPADGLRAAGLTWYDLLELPEAADPTVGNPGITLLPLRVVVDRLAAVPDPVERGRIVRGIFGDTGLAAFEELARGLAAPVDAERDATRRGELKTLGLTPEAVAERPLESLATILDALDRRGSPAERQAAALRLFGPAGRRVEPLARQVALARALATLEALEVPTAAISAGDARAAFDTVRPAVEGLGDDDRGRILAAITERRDRRGAVEPRDARLARLADLDDEQRARAVADLLLQALFGARGPRLFRAAAAVHEGIDHSWVFRYEIPVVGP